MNRFNAACTQRMEDLLVISWLRSFPSLLLFIYTLQMHYAPEHGQLVTGFQVPSTEFQSIQVELLIRHTKYIQA